jgi:Rne/Rng family ribonuclease
MANQILIDSFFGLVRTAIADGTRLLDYYEESMEQGRTKGNIYRGVVKRVDANIQAAFIKYGNGRDGFLPLRDADSVSAVGGSLRVGDCLLVQVVKDELGEKGAALTARLSLSGRYLVYMPGREGEGGISSRASDEERAALKKISAEMKVPENGSIILRTAAINKGISDLQADIDRLSNAYQEINNMFSQGNEPALLFQEAHPTLRYLREYYHEGIIRIWVNEEDVFEQCRQFFNLYEPRAISKVTLSKEGPLMFHRLGLEAEVDKLSLRKVALPSGANIVIDQTEALVAIDVNTAKASGRMEDPRSQKGLEATVLSVNKEAALEISRQLRLRDLGGIIVVDFIDMEEDRHRRQIEEIMRRAMAADKAKVKVFEISPLGTLQISRQRLRKAGPNFAKQTCETCEGKGWHSHPAVNAFSVLRQIVEKLIARNSPGGIQVGVPYPVANELLNDFREYILSLEARFKCPIRIMALPNQNGEPVFAAHQGEPLPRNQEATQIQSTVSQSGARERERTLQNQKPLEMEGRRRRRSRRGGRNGREGREGIDSRVSGPNIHKQSDGNNPIGNPGANHFPTPSVEIKSFEPDSRPIQSEENQVQNPIEFRVPSPINKERPEATHIESGIAFKQRPDVEPLDQRPTAQQTGRLEPSFSLKTLKKEPVADLGPKVRHSKKNPAPDKKKSIAIASKGKPIKKHLPSKKISEVTKTKQSENKKPALNRAKPKAKAIKR